MRGHFGKRAARLKDYAGLPGADIFLRRESAHAMDHAPIFSRVLPARQTRLLFAPQLVRTEQVSPSFDVGNAAVFATTMQGTTIMTVALDQMTLNLARRRPRLFLDFGSGSLPFPYAMCCER